MVCGKKGCLWDGFRGFCVLLFLLLACPLWTAAQDTQGTLDADESVLFFPTIGWEQGDGMIRVNVEAWVFQEERQRILDFALTSYLDVDSDKLSPERRALFEQRARYFHVDSERDETIRVRIGAEVLTLPETNASGRARGEFRVKRDWAEWRADGVGRVTYTLEAPGHALHGRTGHAWILPEEGIFVVSDIDDTIKHSNVLDRKALLRNTFLEPFQAVAGMATWYREMTMGEAQIFFHYLSASPLALYPALSEFLTENGFPEGKLHLRESTSWRTLYADAEENTAHKTSVLEHLATKFPKRKFILIGDSGERDPEIYADFTRKHPGRVLAIHIRNVTGEDKAAPRYQKTFAGISPEHWWIRD
jgi:phosphatidate phosphatase APP1